MGPLSPPAIDAPLLDALMRTRQLRSVDEWARLMTRSRSQLLHAIEQLRIAGCVIHQNPQLGVMLERTSLGCWADYLAWRCGGRRVIEVYQQTSSTQDAARRIVRARGEQAHGAVVVADHQSAGRGRLGRSWHAPAGSNITFSTVRLHPADAEPSPDLFMLATAVAAAIALEVVTEPDSLPIGIKWPNDLMIDGRKVGGILVENISEPLLGKRRATVVGVGVNVGLTLDDLPADQPLLQQKVTSLAMCHRSVHRLLLLGELITRIEAALVQPAEQLVREWRQRNTLADRQLHLRSDGQDIRGVVVDLDPCTGLIVRTQSGELVHLPAASTTLL